MEHLPAAAVPLFLATSAGLFGLILFRRAREIARERREKRAPLDRLFEAVKEARPEAKLEEPILRAAYVSLKEDDRDVRIYRPEPGEIVVRVGPRGRFGLAWVVRWPARCRLLHFMSNWIGRTSFLEHEWTKEFEWYLPDTLTSFLREVMDGEDHRTPFVVLKALPGLRAYRLEHHPRTGLRAAFATTSEEKFVCADVFDSILHHLGGLMKRMNAEEDEPRDAVDRSVPKGKPAPVGPKEKPPLKISDLEWATEDGLRHLIDQMAIETLSRALRASPPAVVARFTPLLKASERRRVETLMVKMGTPDAAEAVRSCAPLVAVAQELLDKGDLHLFPPSA